MNVGVFCWGEVVVEELGVRGEELGVRDLQDWEKGVRIWGSGVRDLQDWGERS